MGFKIEVECGMRGKGKFRSGIRDQEEDSQLGGMVGMKKPISDPE